MNITIICTAALAILIILALLAYAEMTRSAKSNPTDWFHS